MKERNLGIFRDSDRKPHHVTQQRKHWWNKWITLVDGRLEINGRSPFDYMKTPDGKWTLAIHSFYPCTYKVITLCGSTRFKEQFIETQKRLTLDGCIVISVGLFGHSGDEEVWKPGTKEMLDDMHLRKIDLADEIFVINVGGYIGESTKREIAYAESLGKKVNYLEDRNINITEEVKLINFEKGKWYLCTKTHTLFQYGVAYKSYKDGTISDGCRTYLNSDSYRIEYFRPAPPVIIKAGNFYYCHKSILQDGIKEGNTYYSAKDGYLNTDTNVILYGEKDCIDFLFPDLKKNISD